jgi:hypothetical protein
MHSVTLTIGGKIAAIAIYPNIIMPSLEAIVPACHLQRRSIFFYPIIFRAISFSFSLCGSLLRGYASVLGKVEALQFPR